MRKFRINVGSSYRITGPTTEKSAVSYAYDIAKPGESVSIENVDGSQVTFFIKHLV